MMAAVYLVVIGLRLERVPGPRRSDSFRRSTPAISLSSCNCRPARRCRAPTPYSSACPRYRNHSAGRNPCREHRWIFRRYLHQCCRIPARCFSPLTRLSPSAAATRSSRRRRSRPQLMRRSREHPGRLRGRGAAAAGARYRHRRWLPHDGRGSRGTRLGGAARRRPRRLMARANQTPGLAPGLHFVRDVDPGA